MKTLNITPSKSVHTSIAVLIALMTCLAGFNAQVAHAQTSAAQKTDAQEPTIPYGQGKDVYLTASGMAIHNDVLYMTWPSSPGPVQRYLAAINVKDPANPTLLGKLVLNGFPQGVAIAKDRAFVVNGQDLLSIDITQPQQMKITNTLRISDNPMRGPQAIVISQSNTAYLACRRGGVVAINLTNPDQPKNIGQLNLPGFTRDLALADDKLIVAADTLGFHSINLPKQSEKFSGIKAEQITTQTFEAGTFNDVHVVGREYFFTAGHLVISGFLPDAQEDEPQWHRFNQVSRGDDDFFYGRYAHQLAIYTPEHAEPNAPKRIALVADGEAGLAVFDISNEKQTDFLPQPFSAGTRSNAALLAVNVITHKQHAFVIDQNHGLCVFDLANPVQPKRLDNSVNLKK